MGAQLYRHSDCRVQSINPMSESPTSNAQDLMSEEGASSWPTEDLLLLRRDAHPPIVGVNRSRRLHHVGGQSVISGNHAYVHLDRTGRSMVNSFHVHWLPRTCEVSQQGEAGWQYDRFASDNGWFVHEAWLIVQMAKLAWS